MTICKRMKGDLLNSPLKNKRGLIIGIANENSIAWGCAKAFRDAGATLAVTYLNDRAKPYVRPLAESLNALIIAPLDVRDDKQISSLFHMIESTWGTLDFILHSVAFAAKEDLHGRIADCSRSGFLDAMDTSCYSLIKLAHMAEPLMKDGGCILTTSYYGSEKVIPHYGLMGPVKAALESTVKYLAVELGEKKIRVNALSPGPIATRAASGLKDFDTLLNTAKTRAPAHELVSINDVGSYARFLVSDDARLVTGSIVYIDAGLNIIGI